MLHLAAEHTSLDTGFPFSINAGVCQPSSPPCDIPLEESVRLLKSFSPLQPNCNTFVPIDTSCTITCSNVVALNNVSFECESTKFNNHINIRDNTNTDGSFLSKYLDLTTVQDKNKDKESMEKAVEDIANYFENEKMPNDENLELVSSENPHFNEEQSNQEVNIHEIDSAVNSDIEIIDEDDIPLARLASTIPQKGYRANGELRTRKKKRTAKELKSDKEKKHNLLIDSHKVLPPCQANICRKKCVSLICEDERNEINLNFWMLTPQERRNYILATCSRLGIQKGGIQNMRVTEKITLSNITLKTKMVKSKKFASPFFLQHSASIKIMTGYYMIHFLRHQEINYMLFLMGVVDQKISTNLITILLMSILNPFILPFLTIDENMHQTGYIYPVISQFLQCIMIF